MARGGANGWEVRRAQALLWLAALVMRCRQVIDMLMAERNRPTPRPTRCATISPHISRGWRPELQDLDDELRQFIDQNTTWHAADEVLQSAPSVGGITAITLFAELPKLGQLGRQEIATLVGVAPMNCDSGCKLGKCRTQSIRARVRSVYTWRLCPPVASIPSFVPSTKT